MLDVRLFSKALVSHALVVSAPDRCSFFQAKVYYQAGYREPSGPVRHGYRLPDQMVLF